MKILKFHAFWCNPCKVLSKVLEDFTLCEVENLNVDDKVDEARKFRIRSLPTLIFVDNDGNEVDRIVGMTTLQNIEDKVNEALGNTKMEQGT